jgi:hypothetical protein
MPPTVINIAQKCQIARRVNGSNGSESKILWVLKAATGVQSTFLQCFDSLGLFGIFRNRTMCHKVFGVMHPLPVIKKRLQVYLLFSKTIGWQMIFVI